MTGKRNRLPRAVAALVLSAGAIVAVAVYELSPEVMSEVRARAGLATVVEPVPVEEETPPYDPEDLEPTGPAKVRPSRAESRNEVRAAPGATARRPASL